MDKYGGGPTSPQRAWHVKGVQQGLKGMWFGSKAWHYMAHYLVFKVWLGLYMWAYRTIVV